MCLWVKSSFLNIDTMNSGDWTIFVVEVRPVHYRMAFNMSTYGPEVNRFLRSRHPQPV